MLNTSNSTFTRHTNHAQPLAPPLSPTLTNIHPTQLHPNNSDIRILQLNCFNTQAVLHEVLNLNDIEILLLQEPWINTYTHRVPTHTNWHTILPYDYTPTDLQTKFRTCIYITKRLKVEDISVLPSGSPFITAVEVQFHDIHIQRLRLLSFYNRPTTNEGLPVLQNWLSQHSSRVIPTLVGMDSNLHHQHWNPSYRTNVHPKARELVKQMGTTGFKLLSEKGIPTFYPRQRGRPSTIDLTWGNWRMVTLNHSCKTLNETYGSDHQSLLTTIHRATVPHPPMRNTATLKSLNKADFHDAVENQLSTFPDSFETEDHISSGISQLTEILTHAFQKQGKSVIDNAHRRKAWWDEEKLRPLIQTRNRARRWMLRSKLQEAAECYWNWQKYVKQEIEKLKRKHWRSFLAKADQNMTFKALSYTIPATTGSVAPLYREDKSITTEKEEQAELLFFGTSVALTECDLQDVPADPAPPIGQFPSVTTYEVTNIIRNLPNNKAKGDDQIPNELLKLAESLLSPHLAVIFNQCLKLSFYPPQWKNAITAIIRKHDKPDYSEPGAYRPIALLSCISKVLETLLTRRLSYWAESNHAIAEGHTGG